MLLDSNKIRIIDFHAHAFPDAIAERTMRYLEEEGNIKAALDGRVASLVDSMDRTGIAAAVIANIATKPEQFNSILNWSKSIASDRIIPFPSVHPADPDPVGKIEQIAEAGFKGIKLHPYYQDFTVDEPRVFPIYQAVRDSNLVLLLHTGFDLAYDRIRIVDPVRIIRVVDAFPDLKLVTSHLCAWEDWDEARIHMLGKPIYTDISYSIQFMPPEKARELLQLHSPDYIVFGTDSPWSDQKKTLDYVRNLGFGEDWERCVLSDNAHKLLALS